MEWWGKAGDLAMRRSAYTEAISHLEMAIQLANGLGDEARPTAIAFAAATYLWQRSQDGARLRGAGNASGLRGCS